MTVKKLQIVKKMEKKLPFKINDILTVKITALGPKNVGLSEYSENILIIVPNVELGEEVKVKIQNIFSGKIKYATTKVIERVKKEKLNEIPKVGEIIKVKIDKEGPQGSGITILSNNFSILVPEGIVGKEVFIKLIRIKSEYGFGKILDSGTILEKDLLKSNKLESSFINQLKPGTSNIQNKNQIKRLDLSSLGELSLGSKYNILLPKSAKNYGDYLILKLKGSIVFIKLGLGAKLGDSVRIKIMKISEWNKFAVAKIVQLSPMSQLEKQLLIKNNVQKMLQTGLHFGEKAIRCNANMKKFLWLRKKGPNQNKPLMKKSRHVINILKTRSCLTKSLKQLTKYAAKGKTFLFVGTKKSASALIARTAILTKTSFFVNTRWLGGMLTNWKTIIKSLSQVKPILKEKQKIIQNILEKRQKIRKRLVKKVNLLRKQSQKLMGKGKILIPKIRQNKSKFIEKSIKLMNKKKQLLENNQLLVQKYTDLNIKKKILINQYQELKEQKNRLLDQKQSLLKELTNNQLKLKEFKQLFQIGQELLKLQKSGEEKGDKFLTLSYGKLSKLENQNQNQGWLIPNPPKEILAKIINSMKMNYNNISSFAPRASKNQPKSETESNVIVLSKLLAKFVSFLPFIKLYIETLVSRIKNHQILSETLSQNIQIINNQLNELNILNQKLNSELILIYEKLKLEEENIRILQIKLKALYSEQRLLKFLPRLRYLPTPKNKMAETIQILMKKFVDPKMNYPIDEIYDEKLKFTSKKVAAARKQKWQRLAKYFGGITKMAKMNKKQISNNIAIIVGQQEEMNAVYECKKLGIKMFTLVDTNCNPQLSDHIIPTNDDSRNSIKFILGEMLTRIRLAQKIRQKLLSRPIQKF